MNKPTNRAIRASKSVANVQDNTLPASEDTRHLPKSGKTIDPIENPNPLRISQGGMRQLLKITFFCNIRGSDEMKITISNAELLKLLRSDIYFTTY